MRAVVVALVSASMASAAVAHADPAAPARPPREIFDEASVAFERGDVERALRLFREAFERAPHDAVRFNIARCLERLGRFLEARREYELAAASTSLDDKARGEARRRADALGKDLATLVVVGAPAGADVLVNDRALCKLPCKETLDPGSYRVTVRSGEATSSAEATLDRGRTFEVRLEVASAPSPAAVRSTPAPLPPLATTTTGRAGWLTWVGSGAGVVGAAGVVGFGLRDASLHTQYLAQPTAETRDAGLTVRALTNVSIGVAVAGAVAVGLDLLVFRTGRLERAKGPVVGSFAF